MLNFRSLALFILASMTFSQSHAAPNQGPIATLTAPTAGTKYYAPATIDLSATASDPDGSVAKVEFFNGTAAIPGSADTTSPYSFQWTNVPAGTYSIKARATDNAGKTGDSAVVQITVSPITTVIAAPANNSIAPGRTVNVSGTFVGPDNTTIIVTGGAGHSLVAAVSSGTFSASGVELLPGLNRIDVAVARRDGTAEELAISVTAVDPPIAVIKGPLSCGPYSTPATVTLTADALSPQGQVAKVDYFDNGQLIGTASSAPYSVTTTLTAIGLHTITAVATDSFGFSGTSLEPRAITVQSPPPTVSIATPANGAVFVSGTAIPLTATASDPDGSVSRVDYYRAGTVWIAGSSISPSYAVNWTDAPLGNHDLTAVATDNLNSKGTSSPISISVTQNAPPTVSITAPANGATFDAPTDIAILASASDSNGTITEVEFFANALSLGKKTAPSYTVTWQNPPLGSHVLTARAKDNEGAITTSAGVNITVNGVTAAITAPANGTTLAAPAAFTLSATASTSSGTVTKVELFDSTTLLQTFNTSTTTVDINVGLSGVAGGTHVYTVRATDSANRTATSPPVNVTVTAPAIVNLSAPAAGAFYVAPAIVELTASATAGTNPIAHVEFFAGSTLLGVDTTAPYELTWSSAPTGNHVLTAKATDTLGNPTTSSPVAVTVAAAPTIGVAAGIDGSTIADDSVLVTGTVQSSPNSSVTVGGTVAVLASDGQFFVNSATLAPGANAIPVTVTTPGGASATQTITVTSTVSAAFKVSMHPAEGIAPMEVALAIQNPGNAAFGTIEYDINEDGQPDLVATTLEAANATLTYATPGLRRVRVTVKDAQGGVLFTTVRQLYAADAVERYHLVKGVFDGMLGWLKAGDVNAAVSALSPVTREQYRQMFNSVGANIASVATQVGTVRGGSVGDRIGELVIERATSQGPVGFIVTVYRNADGIWRIEGM